MKPREKETRPTPQIQKANAEWRCPLSSSKGCQRSMWCLDKTHQAKALRCAGRKNSIAQPLQGSELSRRERAVAARLAHATPFSARAGRALPQQNPQSQTRFPPATQPTRAGQERPYRLPGLSPLQSLEVLQALPRLRCWLLRTFAVPFFALKKVGKNNSTTKAQP